MNAVAMPESVELRHINSDVFFPNHPVRTCPYHLLSLREFGRDSMIYCNWRSASNS
jgi:hypothetical protein